MRALSSLATWQQGVARVVPTDHACSRTVPLAPSSAAMCPPAESGAAARLAQGGAEVLPLPQARPDNPGGALFPLGLRPAHDGALRALPDVLAWAAQHRDDVEAALLAHGGIFFCGFPFADAAAFDAFMSALGVPPKPYVGGAAVRHVVTGAVFTSNESPPGETIPFHHEMALVASPPSRIAFFCETPAAAGGETSALLSGAVGAAVAASRPAFAARLRAEGLRYSRVMSEHDDASSAQGRGWRSTYAASSREEAEAAMRATGVASWEWLPDGGLRTETAALPAFVEDPRSGETLFHNALAAVYLGWTDARNSGPKSVRFGGGEPLDGDDVAEVARIMQAHAVNVPWQRGDVMLLDNRRAMHARRPFTPPRRILAYLCV